MKVLFIVHATSWCDKASVAREGIKKLIQSESYDRIIEIISSHDDIYDKKYLTTKRQKFFIVI